MELTEDDQPEMDACDGMFPDDLIEELEKEEEEMKVEVDLFQELILNDDIYTGVAPPNQVYPWDDAPDKVQLEMAMVQVSLNLLNFGILKL